MVTVTETPALRTIRRIKIGAGRTASYLVSPRASKRSNFSCVTLFESYAHRAGSAEGV